MNIDLGTPDVPKFYGTTYVYTCRSKQDPDVTYVTVIDDLEETSNNFCTCPGWKFRRGCRHMNEAAIDLKHRMETRPEVLARR